MKKVKFVLKLVIVITLNTAVFSQSYEESMGSGMAEIGSRVRKNRVRKEMKDMGYFKNSMPSYNFVPPSGWSLVSRDDNSKTYILGHTTIPGIVMTTGHQITSVQELINQLQNGIYTQEMQLIISGIMNNYNSNGISANLSGYMGGYEVRGFLISITNGTSGGVTILSFTYPQLFTGNHINVVKSIANGVTFF
jgi:hypothetical protein